MSDELVRDQAALPKVAAPSSDVISKSVERPIMELRDVSVAFSGRPAVRDVSFDVATGQVTALIGPSGSGKTTLLRALESAARHRALGKGNR